MNRELKTTLIVLVLIAGLFVWFFFDALFGSGMFVFRDAAHFYYPLFQFTAEEWAAGRVPLWNPYENLGQPLAGNPAASVFYPGKLVFALPIDFAWAYKLYVMGHVLLAAWAAYRLARRFDASAAAAGVAALSYAFSGNVLHQHCNVIFLVGAAWLPLALLAADRMLGNGSGVRGQGSGAGDQGSEVRSQGSWRVRWAVAFGVVLAMMVLGGDPQMAYNAGLLAAGYALWLWAYDSPVPIWKRFVGCVKRTRRKESERTGQERPAEQPVRRTHPTRLLRSRPALLALAAITGLILSAIQVLPSLEFARHSDRVGEPIGERLMARTEPGTHSEHRYHFSVGPWRLAEYLWPNVSGRQYPVHRRWINVVPAEGRIWTPSLYMGVLPLLLALSAMRFRRARPRDSTPRPQEPRDRWLSWSIVVAVLAGFGYYGLGWVMQEIRFAAGGEAAVPGGLGAPFGGVYWLISAVLPGYGSFRYPAKLLVVAGLGLSMLAARGWDRMFADPSPRFRRALLYLAGLSLCGVIAACVVRPFRHDWLCGVEPDVLFGPLDTLGAANDLLAALLQTTILCGVFWVLLRPSRLAMRWRLTAALVLVAVDLAVANRWMVVCAPARQWTEMSEAAAKIEKSRASGLQPQRKPDAVAAPVRVHRHPDWMPPEWKSSGTPSRMADGMRWERDTLYPNYNLTCPLAITEVRGTMMPADYQAFLSAAARGPARYLLAEYAILPGKATLPGGQRIEIDASDASLWLNHDHLPRAWSVHEVEAVSPLASSDSAAIRRRTERALCTNGGLRDLRESALVESSRPSFLPMQGGSGPHRKEKEASRLQTIESCRLLDYQPSKVEIEAVLHEPGLVVLCDQLYPGWELEVHTDGQTARPAEILRANRLMRGVWLPEGRHRLVYRYCPASFHWGAIICGLGWLGLILALAGAKIAGRRR